MVILLLLCSCERNTVTESKGIVFPTNTTPVDSILATARMMQRQFSHNDNRGKAAAATYMGIYYSRTGAYINARLEYNKALRYLGDKKDTLILAKIYSGLSNSFKHMGEFPEALQMGSMALVYRKGDSLATAGLYANIAQIFQLQQDLSQATIHLHQALSYCAGNKENISYLLILHTLANVHGMSGKIDSALILDEEGIAISKKINDLGSESTFLDNKANCFMYSNRPDSARYYFHQSLAIDAGLGNKKQMSDTWLNLGILEKMVGNNNAAIQSLSLGIDMANATGYRNGAMLGWKYLAEIYESQQRFKESLEAKSKHYDIKDSLINLKKETAIAEWKALYETDRKEDQIRLQSMQLKQKNLSIWFIGISSVLSLSIAYLANRRNKERKEKRYRESLLKRDQELAVKVLIAEENERKRIAADLHDGIGQSLTAAWLNLQATQPLMDTLSPEHARLLRTTTQLVGDSCAEIRAVSHNMMPNVLFQKGLLPALHELIGNINDQQLYLSLSSNEEDIQLDKTTELVLYRIIQECVSNVIRHAEATELYITLNKEDKQLSIMIEDNGIGFNTQAMQHSEGIGLQNIKSRVQYLRGSVEWNHINDNNSGTIVTIYLPLHYGPNE